MELLASLNTNKISAVKKLVSYVMSGSETRAARSRSIFVLAREEFFFLLDHSSFESADDVDCRKDNHNHKQDYLDSSKVADEFLNASSESESQSREQAHPYAPACQRQ